MTGTTRKDFAGQGRPGRVSKLKIDERFCMGFPEE
jgi:hypothetical protein